MEMRNQLDIDAIINHIASNPKRDTFTIFELVEASGLRFPHPCQSVHEVVMNLEDYDVHTSNKLHYTITKKEDDLHE